MTDSHPAFQAGLFHHYCQALEGSSSPFVHRADRLHLQVLPQTDSTNRVAWESLAHVPEGSRVLVIADRQTAGRGQWGRSWQSQAGGLYLSLGIRADAQNPIPLDRVSLLPFFTAWGVAQGLQKHQIPVTLKWPNDLLLNHQKLGGILVETRLGGSVVIGIGLNWQNQPPEMGIALAPYQQHHNLAAIESLEHLAAIVLEGLIWGYHIGSDPQASVVDFIEQYDR